MASKETSQYRLRFVGHVGIDIFRTQEDVNPEWWADRYEDRAFQRLTHQLTQLSSQHTKSIGPVLINRAFRHSPLSTEVRPDGMVFEQRYNAETGSFQTTLTTLWEFKLAVFSEPEPYIYKLNGFRGLLENLRELNLPLGRILNQFIPPAIGLPDSIHIPHDSEITVVFVSPKPYPKMNDIQHPFHHPIKQFSLKQTNEEHTGMRIG